MVLAAMLSVPEAAATTEEAAVVVPPISGAVQPVKSPSGFSRHLHGIQSFFCSLFGLLSRPSAPSAPLLGDLPADMPVKKTVVLDLDETLVHSSFQPIPNPDFVLQMEIEHRLHTVHVVKRPGVEAFLEALRDKFEVVVFTASLGKYADAVIDCVDTSKVVQHRLFRESCTVLRGHYIKDLSRLGRDIKDCIIVDNSPASYLLHPQHAVPISSFLGDKQDTALQELLPMLLELSACVDVRDSIRKLLVPVKARGATAL